MKISSFHCFVLILFFFTAMGYAQIEKIIKPDFWTNFKGTLGEDYLHLTLFPDTTNNRIIGSFCYNKEERLYAVEGKFVDQHTITLQVKDSIIPEHTFNLNFEDQKGFYFLVGTFRDMKTAETKAVKLGHSSSSYGSIENRYADFKQNTQEVEQFMQRTKRAILNDDRNFITDHLIYPAIIKINNKKFTVRNKDDFIAQYDAIITSAFKNKIQKYHTHHLFSNHSGASLANGAIWISGYNPKTRTLGAIKINSINLTNLTNEGPH